MRNRKPALLGGALLVLAVGAVGALWFLSQNSAGPLPGVTLSAAAAGPPMSDLGFGAVERSVEARDPIPLDRAESIPMIVYLTPTCGCCADWVGHIEDYGFDVTLEYRVDLTGVKQEFGVRPHLASCHTAVVNGYVFEGHVPGDDVRRFLAEAPDVQGLAVPGMPIGSPGMEFGDVVEPYDVLAFTADGRTQVYSRYGRQ